jgi:hypothetical protein
MRQAAKHRIGFLPDMLFASARPRPAIQNHLAAPANPVGARKALRG